MIRERSGAGRASGVLMFGFLAGLTIGAPLAGWSIDAFDSYRPAWAICALGCLAGAASVARRRPETAR
jgi:MFS family permease